MAENVQKARVDVFLNGEAANRELQEMKTRLVGLKEELHRLETTPVSLLKPGEVKKMEELRQVVKKTEKSVESLEEKEKAFARTLKNINSASLKDLQAAARRLSFEVKELTPGTQAFIEKSKQLQQVNTRIVQLRTSFKGLVEEEKAASLSIKGLTESFNRYFAIATAGIAAITGVSMAFRQCAEEAAKLDDTYADVMKTTGLMKEQVSELDKELMKINTRTSREQLLLLARDAGKLGITGKENILGFVRAADQIQVALGEDLGEGAIKQLGKIADVLGYTQSMGIERSLLSIASSINAVGQASTASEAYLVEFTQRLAGVAAQTNISAANIIGFASGLDQSAMKVEMAATAFQKFIMKIYEDPAKFAEYANMQVEQFADLLKNDANQAIITILKSLKDKDGFSALVPIFQDMGLDGARAVSVLAAMATNITAVTDAQALANQEFAKATSVTEEYNTKNNNLQAQLEKARKEFQNARIELGQSLNPIMLKSTKITTHLIKALATYGKEIRNVAIAIGVLTLAIKAKNIAHGISNALDAASITLTKTKVVVTNLVKLAYFKLTKQTEAAAVAQAALNGAMNASVFGLVATAVVGLTIAITRWVKKSKEANTEMERMEQIEKRVNEEYAEGASKVRVLTSIVENNNIALSERKKALEELKRIVPNYHGSLTEEGKLINSNKEAIDEYCKSLRKQIRLQANSDELMELEKKIIKLEDKKAKAEAEAQKALIEAGGDATEFRSTIGGLKITKYGRKKGKVNAIDKELQGLYDQEKKLGEKVAELTTDPIEAAIQKVKDEYSDMISQVSKEYVDDPKAGQKEIQRLREERDKKIKELKKTNEETKETVVEGEDKVNSILTQAQFEYLQERQEKLTKKEKEMVTKGYAALSAEDSKALKARYDKLMKADIKAEDKRYQEQVKQLQKEQKAAENDLLSKFLHGEDEMTYKEYQERLTQIQRSFLKERLVLAKQEGKDTTEIEAQLLQLRSDKMKQEYNDQLNELNECYADEQRALKMSLSAQEITQDEYDSQMLESKVRYLKEKLELAKEYGQDETAIMQAYQEAIKESQDLAFQQIEKLKKQAQEVTDSVNPKQANARQEDLELKELQHLYDLKLISEETFQKKKREIVKKYGKANLDDDLGNIRDYAQAANQIMEGASNFVTALKEAESAKLEAEYQKQLTAAGDNAEQREAIEAEYEQKKLDLQKKYADVDMAINIAKAIASGALAAVEAFAAAGGNPVLGAVFAALIAVTTAAEVASIIAQRNAIKSMSVNNSGSSSAPKTGNRTMTGYSEGGETPWAASDNTPVGIVHANEYVIPAWMKRREPRLIADLERYRKAGSNGRSGSMSRGFADGGHTSTPAGYSPSSALQEIDFQTMREFNDIMRYCAENGLWVKYGDILIAKGKYDNFKKQTSR